MVFITDGNGHLVQHIQYVPFGEVFIEQRNSTWSTPYKFNGKELDEETGLAYYHARYYDPRTSVWLSVDPLKGKTLNVSAYVYAYNNPVRYIDPDGRFATRIGAWLDRRKNGESGRIIKNKHGQYSYEKSDGTGSNFSRIAVYGKNGYKGKQSSSNNESSSGGSRQKAGYIFFGLNSSQQMDWIKADVIYGMIDASGFLYPFSNPDSKAKLIFDAAKKAQFIMEYDFETAFKAGVEMDLPEMDDPGVIIMTYNVRYCDKKVNVDGGISYGSRISYAISDDSLKKIRGNRKYTNISIDTLKKYTND